jgi:hypothetical protein
MIARWLKTAVGLFACFCVATLLAEAIILAYFGLSWQLDREKVIQMLAIAQGIDLFAAQEEARADEEEIPPEEPSYQDWLDRRATMFRDLELREQALAGAVAQLQLEQNQLAADRETFQRSREAFETQLATLQAEAQDEGMETLISILESIKPSQAKGQILEMLDNDEIEKVVVLFNGMTSSKRAKIIGEFESDAETEKVSEILHRIGEGEPVASMAEETLGQLPSGKLTGT